MVESWLYAAGPGPAAVWASGSCRFSRSRLCLTRTWRAKLWALGSLECQRPWGQSFFGSFATIMTEPCHAPSFVILGPELRFRMTGLLQLKLTAVFYKGRPARADNCLKLLSEKIARCVKGDSLGVGIESFGLIVLRPSTPKLVPSPDILHPPSPTSPGFSRPLLTVKAIFWDQRPEHAVFQRSGRVVFSSAGECINLGMHAWAHVCLHVCM